MILYIYIILPIKSLESCQLPTIACLSFVSPFKDTVFVRATLHRQNNIYSCQATLHYFCLLHRSKPLEDHLKEQLNMEHGMARSKSTMISFSCKEYIKGSISQPMIRRCRFFHLTVLTDNCINKKSSTWIHPRFNPKAHYKSEHVSPHLNSSFKSSTPRTLLRRTSTSLWSQ